MRKYIILLTLFLTLSLTLISHGESGEITLTVDKDNIKVRDIVNVYVNLKQASGIKGIEISIEYDDEYLNPLDGSFIRGELMEGVKFHEAINEIKADDSTADFMGALLRGSSEIIETDELLKLRFRALKLGKTNINIDKVKLIDEDLERINVNSNSLDIIVYKQTSKDTNRQATSDEDFSGSINISQDIGDNFTITRSVIPNNLNDNLILKSQVYDITYNGISLESGNKLPKEIELSIKYDDVKEEDEEGLGIYYFNEARNKWVYIGGEVDKQSNNVKVKINHLTKFAVFVNPKLKSLNDISQHWSSIYIKRLVGMEAISGYEDGSFKPEKEVTRGEFAKIIVKALDLDAIKKDINISDENNTQDWTKPYIIAALENNIMKGYDDGSFKGDKPMTRAEVATVLGRLLQNYESKNEVIKYIDKDEIPQWALNEIGKCASSGIINGYKDNTLKPNKTVTRGEVAKMIYMTLWEMGI